VLRPLCDANRAILAQKLGLLEALSSVHGPLEASRLYRTPAAAPSLGGATVGQHYRHSMDHIEHAVKAAGKAVAGLAASTSRPHSAAAAKDLYLVLPYDQRQRGGPDESDIVIARERIAQVQRAVDEILLRCGSVADEEGTFSSSSVDGDDFFDGAVAETPVAAEFMLSGDSLVEFRLPSTVARELGFGVHHAIHHMAMVRIIVLSERWLQPDQLEPDFGRAPSTIRHDRAARRQEEAVQ
jgi:hypothetical protein